MGISLSDWAVGDAERTRRLEPEALVIAGVAQQNDQREPSCLGPPEELGHEGPADARALVGRPNRQWGDGDCLPSSDVPPGRHDMADDSLADNGDQLELGHDGSTRPRGRHDVELLACVSVRARERVPDHLQDGVVVGGDRTAYGRFVHLDDGTGIAKGRGTSVRTITGMPLGEADALDMPAVVDRLFSEPSLAALYDACCMGRPDFDFYLPLVMSADAVLDVGCGTGELLRLARQAGHVGRLCGLDPADAMLDQARLCPDVDWILGDLSATRWDRAFDLVVMTGHAFQVLVADEDIRASLGAIRSALTDDGRFVFETRNPNVGEWETWTPDNAVEVVSAGGAGVRMAHEVETPVADDLVSFRTTFTSTDWDRPQISRSTLRFLDARTLSVFLSDADLVIEDQFGNWDGTPLTEKSPEIITVARRA